MCIYICMCLFLVLMCVYIDRQIHMYPHVYIAHIYVYAHVYKIDIYSWHWVNLSKVHEDISLQFLWLRRSAEIRS